MLIDIIGGKVLCAAPLVIPQYSAYNVKESSKSGGKYLYIAIGMDILTEVSTLVSSSEHPLCSPPFHAFGKSYPAPNLLQVCVVLFIWSTSSVTILSIFDCLYQRVPHELSCREC